MLYSSPCPGVWLGNILKPDVSLDAPCFDFRTAKCKVHVNVRLHGDEVTDDVAGASVMISYIHKSVPIEPHREPIPQLLLFRRIAGKPEDQQTSLSQRKAR